MGGMQTFTTALNNLDKFAYLADLAEAAAAGADFRSENHCGGAFAVQPHSTRRSSPIPRIGSAEGPGTKQFSDGLTAAGVHNVYFESPGTAHEWLTWRRCLNDFAPRFPIAPRRRLTIIVRGPSTRSYKRARFEAHARQRVVRRDAG